VGKSVRTIQPCIPSIRMIYTTMQAVPPVLPLLNKGTGEVIERSPERHANLVRFQAELEVRS
jgi:hypothetical protein